MSADQRGANRYDYLIVGAGYAGTNAKPAMLVAAE